MTEQTASASEVREKFSEYLDRVEKSRVLIQWHGKAKAYLISVRELRAMEETMSILENTELMESITRGMVDAEAGRTRPAREVFSEIDAEFREEP